MPAATAAGSALCGSRFGPGSRGGGRCAATVPLRRHPRGLGVAGTGPRGVGRRDVVLRTLLSRRRDRQVSGWSGEGRRRLGRRVGRRLLTELLAEERFEAASGLLGVEVPWGAVVWGNRHRRHLRPPGGGIRGTTPEPAQQMGPMAPRVGDLPLRSEPAPLHTRPRRHRDVAPLPVEVPMSTQILPAASSIGTPLPQRVVPTNPDAEDSAETVGPRSAAYQVAYRLTGSSRQASAIADNAVDAAARARGADAGPAAIGAAVGSAVEAVVAAADAVLTADLDGDPFAQHRARLRRDLARWPRRERQTLALRHLVGLTPDLVAEVLGWEESDVRDVTKHWVADDSNLNAVIDLSDYGRLFGRVRPAGSVGRHGRDPLEHLDRPQP